MKELTVFTHEQFGAIRAVKVDNEVYFVGKDLAEILGYKNISDALSCHVDNEDKIMVDKTHPSNGIEFDYKELGQRGGWLIKSNGIISLIQKSKTKSMKYKEEFKNWLVLENLISNGIIIESRKEIEFIDILEEQLNIFGLTGTRQHSIKNEDNSYRIDYYIPALNIAIEYDENNHDGYSYCQHEGRQINIEEQLNCRFIRVSDDKTHIENSAIVIKEIFNIKESL